MLRWKHFNWALGTALGCSLWGAGTVQAVEPASPLERLKQRSAESRWLEMKESLLQKQAEPKHFDVEPLFSSEATTDISRPLPTGTPLPVGDVGAWRSADEAPLPQLQTFRSEGGSATAATTPAPDGLGTSSVASSAGAPPFPEAARPQISETAPQMEATQPLVEVETSINKLPEVNRLAPRRHISVPDPYAVKEATLVEATAQAGRRDSADNLPEHHLNQLDRVFPEQGAGQPLIVPNPEKYLVETQRLAAAHLPPAPLELAQNDEQLPAPLPKGNEDLYSFRPITEIEPFRDYAPDGPQAFPDGDLRTRSPEVLPLPVQGSLVRTFAPTQYQWEPANVFHNPLYFEDVELERYGHAYPWGLQPAASLAKFGVQFIGLPYSMALDPMWDEQYALGYYRPGDCAPKLHYQIPLDKKAAITAAGVYTGLFFIFP